MSGQPTKHLECSLHGPAIFNLGCQECANVQRANLVLSKIGTPTRGGTPAEPYARFRVADLLQKYRIFACPHCDRQTLGPKRWSCNDGSDHDMNATLDLDGNVHAKTCAVYGPAMRRRREEKEIQSQNARKQAELDANRTRAEHAQRQQQHDARREAHRVARRKLRDKFVAAGLVGAFASAWVSVEALRVLVVAALKGVLAWMQP